MAEQLKPSEIRNLPTLLDKLITGAFGPPGIAEWPPRPQPQKDERDDDEQ